MWYLLHICYDFDMVVNPFFRAVLYTILQCPTTKDVTN